MTLLAAPTARRTAIAGAALLALLAGPLGAQVELSHTDDAAPVPRGMLRLRITNAWTRYDQRYGPAGLVQSGDALSADALGVAQFPLLTPVETAFRSLSGNPRTRLSLGRLTTSADTRIVTTPIAVEYGLTRRLSVGVIVPVVQTRRTVGVRVNQDGAPGNAGLVPLSQRSAAASANEAARASASGAATQLLALIRRCEASQGSQECAGVTADPPGAAAALARARQLAAGAGALGTTAADAVIAPRAIGTVALEIELQRNALNRQLQQYLGAGAVQASQVYFAPTDFSYIDFQGRDGAPGLLQSPLAGGLDSIRTTERIGFGDVTIGAQYLVFDRFQRDAMPLRGTLQARLAVGGSVRLGTSIHDTVTNLVDIGTGEGPGFELRTALDLISGRVGGTVAGRYSHSFARTVRAPLYGDPESGFPIPVFGPRERRAGDVIGIDLTPRYLLSEVFAIDGHYGLERSGSAAYARVTDTAPDVAGLCAVVSCAGPGGTTRSTQRAGLGLRYSTVDAYSRGRARYPFEVSFTHLTTVSGDPGIPQLTRDQIQLRLFYRLLGR
jgi:hypothetical protein